jgi:hypothetical protein
MRPREVVAAVLIATSSNNLLKAAYCAVFAGWRVAYAPALALVALSVWRRCSCDNGWKSGAKR